MKMDTKKKEIKIKEMKIIEEYAAKVIPAINEKWRKRIEKLYRNGKDKERKWANHIKEYCHSKNKKENHQEADRALVLFLGSLGYVKIINEWENVKK